MKTIPFIESEQQTEVHFDDKMHNMNAFLKYVLETQLNRLWY